MTKAKQIEQVVFVNSRAVEQRVGLSRWTLWRMETEGRFPQSMKVGHRRLWVASEIEDWMQLQIKKRR